MKTRLLSMLMVAGLLATLAPAPAIAAAAMSPTSGPNTGGTLVSITGGSGFSISTTVRFTCGSDSPIAVGVTSISADGTSLTFVTPNISQNATSSGLCAVATALPDTIGLPGFLYTVGAPSPVVLTPATGKIGTSVTLSAPGQNIPAGVPVVRVVDHASTGGPFWWDAVSVMRISSTSVLFLIPTGACPASGTATRAVMVNPSGVAPGVSSIIGIPAFTCNAGNTYAMVPTSGPVTGGTTVQLTGQSGTFSLSCTVLGFVLTPLTPTSVAADGSRMTFVTPAASAGSVNVAVGVAAWASAGSCPGAGGTAGTFTYSGTGGGGTGVPSLSPTTGPVGTVIAIVNGVGFSVATLVSLSPCGSTVAPTTVAADGRSLTFVAPSCALASVQTVSTSNPTYAGIGTFTYGVAPPYTPPTPGTPVYVYPPVVSLVTPSSGPVGGGNAVAVTGANFQSGVRVSFGTVASTSVGFVNSTSLTVVVPAGTGTVSVTVLNPDGLSAQLTGAYTYTGSQGYTCVAGTAVGVTAMNATYTTTTKVVKPNAYVTYRFSCTSAAAGQHITVLGAQKNSAGAWSAFTPFTSRIADGSGNILFNIRAGSPSWWSFRAQIGGVYSNAVQSRWMN